MQIPLQVRQHPGIHHRGWAKVDPEKIKAGAECPRPKAQRLLGFTNFYHRFIHDHSRVAAPLIQLTSSKIPLQWTCFMSLLSSWNQLNPDSSKVPLLVANHWGWLLGVHLCLHNMRQKKSFPLATSWTTTFLTGAEPPIVPYDIGLCHGFTSVSR